MTERLAYACARRPWRTIVAWIVAIVVAVLLVGAFLGDALTSEAEVTNDPESLQGYDLIAERFPQRQSTSEIVVVRSERSTADDPAFRSRVEELVRLGRETGAVAQARSYLRSDDPSLVSPDRHAALIALRLREPPEDNVEEVIDVVRAENGKEGFTVAMTGSNTTDFDLNELSQRDLEEGELQVGLPAALVVLVLVFGALVAASLPLVLALVSIVVALGLTALVGQGFVLSVFVVNMLTGMGLALGIDYALFVVSRFREERRDRREKVEAIATAGATASRAVLFSGSSFVLAMLGLLLVQSTIMRSLAAGAILVGIVSVIAALTLLPAVLALLGDRVNRLRVPIIGRAIEREDAAESRFWGAIVYRVLRRPVVSLVVAVALLIAAASPVFTMNIGAAGIETLPDELVSKQGLLALERSFPATGTEPAEIVVDGDVSSPDVAAGVDRLRRMLNRDDDFGRLTFETSPQGDTGVLTAQVAADPLGDRAIEAVETLRSDYVPSAFDGVDARVLVTGTTAENIDYFDVMGRWLPIVIAFVLGLSFLLLTVAFRSIVVSATAIVVNLLSVGAAYGLLVLVFQHGAGAGFLGFQQVDTIEAWVPLFLFAVLFGLSMDYQVFLLSRIRERYARLEFTRGAVAFGITSTAHIITGAALIIVAVFAGFAMGDLVMFQQMGFGIAVALLIDATIVRSVLVPAIMQLLGRWNWYLPSWLQWLPHLEVEREVRRPEPEPLPARTTS
ncbi:MAG: MMPL family transporter [Actinomycetota bacterium]|nr:MMPL family transporter [Actinomycetota bacterium]